MQKMRCCIEFYRRERTKVKERGRRSAWDEKAMKDLVDIIVNNQVSQKILLFTNMKNVTNSRQYEQVIQELKQRCDARGEKYNFDMSQTQEKFQRCVEEEEEEEEEIYFLKQ